MNSPVWDPAQYLRHADHRTRPFLDLLARIPLPPDAAGRVADLGCGAGNVTALLCERWPRTRVTGYDNSPRMLERAAAHAGDRLSFAFADAGEWTPEPGVYDLIVSNALFQWVPGHAQRFPALVAGLRPGGVFAFQVPGNFDAPSHTLLRELCGSARWADRLGGLLRHDSVPTPAEYHARLSALGGTADVWETTYLHPLTGDDPVLDWVKGTALRPVLTALADDPASRTAFLAEYAALLRDAYPPGADGTTLLPFRRLFAVATRTETLR
ncbi:trans-aconitate 2-methyltransferase [Streptomyces sp. NPDC060194]|uniref:trans-aconitate 2-methyltransferase n=1 Tax=Streptomyces sp. NPDC060194 TaxID=3347069 RepID=UPI003657963B